MPIADEAMASIAMRGRASARQRSFMEGLRTPWDSWSLLYSLGDAVPCEFSIKRRRIDAKPLGRARLVPVFTLQHPRDVRAFYRLERRIRWSACRDERFHATFADALGQCTRLDFF